MSRVVTGALLVLSSSGMGGCTSQPLEGAAAQIDTGVDDTALAETAVEDAPASGIPRCGPGPWIVQELRLNYQRYRRSNRWDAGDQRPLPGAERADR